MNRYLITTAYLSVMMSLAKLHTHAIELRTESDSWVKQQDLTNSIPSG